MFLSHTRTHHLGILGLAETPKNSRIHLPPSLPLNPFFSGLRGCKKRSCETTAVLRGRKRNPQNGWNQENHAGTSPQIWGAKVLKTSWSLTQPKPYHQDFPPPPHPPTPSPPGGVSKTRRGRDSRFPRREACRLGVVASKPRKWFSGRGGVQNWGVLTQKEQNRLERFRHEAGFMFQKVGPGSGGRGIGAPGCGSDPSRSQRGALPFARPQRSHEAPNPVLPAIGWITSWCETGETVPGAVAGRGRNHEVMVDPLFGFLRIPWQIASCVSCQGDSFVWGPELKDQPMTAQTKTRALLRVPFGGHGTILMSRGPEMTRSSGQKARSRPRLGRFPERRAPPAHRS